LSATAADRLGVVRAWWRLARPPKPLATRLEAVYVLALAAGTIGLLLYGTASSALAKWITPATLPEWGPAVLLVALVLAGRWGRWQGPVVFARGDVAFMLGAPLPRSGLVRPRLGWALARGAAVGVVVGAVVLVGLSGRGRAVGLAPAIGLLAGLALCGVLGMTLAWAVQCSPRVSRWVVRAIPLVALVGAGMVALAHAGGGGRDAVLWSGPWGWALQPVAGVSAARGAAALALLALASLAVGLAAFRHAAACSTERHALRAEAREGAIASLGALDMRSAQLALRGVETRASRLRRVGIPAPRRAALAIPWRDATATIRAPGRVVESVVLAAAGAALALTNGNHLAAAAVAALLSYAAVTRLLEPLRLEVDAPGAARTLLIRPFGRVLLSHVVVALLLVTLADALTAVPCAVAHVIVARPGELVLLLLLTLPTVALCAALSARRGGRMPLEVLFFASSGPDPSGGGLVVLAWLLAWPAMAAAIAGGATHLAATAQGVGAAVLLALVAPFVLGSLLSRTLPS
jgi:hypothetical protein